MYLFHARKNIFKCNVNVIVLENRGVLLKSMLLGKST